MAFRIFEGHVNMMSNSTNTNLMKIRKYAGRIVCGVLLAGIFGGCRSGADMEGIWLEPVPGMGQQMQGFRLEPGGRALSVGMATLQYEAWERKGDRLILSGKSMGNGQTLPFVDTLDIERLTPDSLVLRRGAGIWRYVRGTREDGAQTEKTEAEERLAVKGRLVIGHEVRSFVAEGDSADYWIVDKTGDLTRRYDALTGGTRNGTPVYAELEVLDLGPSDEGFAESYDGVYRIVKVDSLSLYK